METLKKTHLTNEPSESKMTFFVCFMQGSCRDIVFVEQDFFLVSYKLETTSKPPKRQ